MGFTRRNLLASAAAIAVVGPSHVADAAIVAASAKAPAIPLPHYWSQCVGAGRANEGLRAAWLEQLRTVHDACGFRYCRFHGLFHDDMFVYTEQAGAPVYNWQYVDELFDRMIAIGVRPFVELGFMPKALASTDQTQFWWKGNVSPPKDYAKWGALITEFARHAVARYGIEEVASWYFEVWNEPNLHGFWGGTRSQYFELYKISAQALKAISPRLRVGGPATSNFVGDRRFDGEVEDRAAQQTNKVADLTSLPWHGAWIDPFLAYCAEEKLPVDFVSTHPYPTDFAFDPGSGRNRGRTRELGATKADLQWLKAAVRKSAYPGAEIHLTEWSSSPSSSDHTHDYLQAAAFIIRVNIDCVGLANSLSYWTFTDVFEEGGAGKTAFHGGFGLINYQGIAKPAFHAYRMLHALGDELISWSDGIAVTRNRATGKLVILAIHYPPEVRDALSFGDRDQAKAMLAAGKDKRFDLTLSDIQANAEFALERLDQHHGNAVATWEAMGAPPSPTLPQIAALRQAGMDMRNSTRRADGNGLLRLSETLAPWTCVLIRQV